MFHVRYILLFVVLHIGSISNFDLGVQYIYDYKTDVSSGALKYGIAAELLLTPIWGNPRQGRLIKTEIRKVSLAHPGNLKTQNKERVLDMYKSAPFCIYVSDGKVSKLFSDPSEPIAAKNMKKAIASILQYKTSSQDTVESDVRGTCKVSYKVNQAAIEKLRSHCDMPNQEPSLQHPNEVLSATLLESSKAFYELIPGGGDGIRKFMAKDILRMASNLWVDNSLTIESESEMSLRNAVSGTQTVSGEDISAAIADFQRKHQNGNLVEERLEPAVISEQRLKEEELIKKVSGLKKYLETSNLASTSSASAFLKLVKLFRQASKNAIRNLLKNREFKSVYPQLLDVIAFSASQSSVEAAFEALDFTKSDSDHLERFLQSLSLIPHPNENVFNKVLAILKKPVKSEKIKAAAIATLGSLAKRMYNTKERDQVQRTTKEFLENGFKSCTSDNCRMQYLRGFRNAALQSSIDLLSNIAVNGGQPALEALMALIEIGIQHFPLKCEDLAKTIFYQLKGKQDTSSRILAADLLIECHPSKGTLRGYLRSLGEPHDHELLNALISRLLKRMEKCEKLRSEVQGYLRDGDTTFYASLLHGESSSVHLEKSLMTTSEANSSYSIFMEMLPGGLLKRSSFDVNVDTKRGKLHILSVGMFAGGLGSLAGGTEEESEETKAGMELTVLGVSLRPYTFFEGTSELMGHVWSGTASEPTPALQGNILITDVNEVRVFQNGMPILIKMNGAMSADLSAFIQISLWNRNSHSEVQNKVALVMGGSFNIKQPFDVEESITFRGSSSIDFITDFDFYEMPFKMCLRMSQPEFVFWNQKKAHLSLKSSRFSRKKSKTKRIIVPAKSFHMYKKNDEICSAMLN